MSDVNAIPQWFSGSRAYASRGGGNCPIRADSPHYVGTDAGTEPRGLVPHHQRSDLRRGDRGASGRGRPVRQAARAIHAKGKVRIVADARRLRWCCVRRRTHLHWCQGSWDVDCGRCGERAWRGGVRLGTRCRSGRISRLSMWCRPSRGWCANVPPISPLPRTTLPHCGGRCGRWACGRRFDCERSRGSGIGTAATDLGTMATEATGSAVRGVQ